MNRTAFMARPAMIDTACVCGCVCVGEGRVGRRIREQDCLSGQAGHDRYHLCVCV